MMYKKAVILVVALLMVFSLNLLAKEKVTKVSRVNVAPLMKVPKGGISSVDQLKTLVEKYADRIKAGFEKAGAGSVFPAFMEQVKTVPIKDVDLPKGQKLEWMLFYAAKKVKVIDNVEWVGKKTLPCFALIVQSECKDYYFVIPKACGNISLKGTKNSYATCDMKVTPAKANIGDTITVDLSGSKCAHTMEVEVFHEGQRIEFKKLDDPVWKTSFKKPGNYVIKAKVLNVDGVLSKNACEEKVYINYPPECDLVVTPASGYVGEPFKVDASGSKDKDGQVVKAEFTVTKDGTVVDSQTITTVPFIWNKTFKKSAIYKITVTVTDDFGALSSNLCEAILKVQKRLYLLVEGGPGIAKGTYSGYAFGRLGFTYLIIPEKLSILASAGAALKIGGEAFKNHFLSNLLLNAHFNDFFLGAGIGYSSEVRDPDWGSGLDIVGNLGFDIFQSFNKKGSIFGEIRVPTGTGLSFKEAHMFLLGFRYIF
jgi:hypothetical protein